MLRVWFFIALGFFPVYAAERTIEFSHMTVDEPPPGFRSALMGHGRLGTWKIVETEVPPVLGFVTEKAQAPHQKVVAQTGRDPTEDRYPILMLDDQEFGDFTVSTRFKLQAGVIEQMAGIAFRMQNESNYFYIRASGLYNTLRFAYVENGQIIDPQGVDIPIEKGVWHELKIEGKGTQFTCWYDGKLAMPPINNPHYSFGKIGLWTKSDSVSYFTDLHISYKPREALATILVRDLIGKYGRLKNIRIVGRPDTNGALQVLASVKPEEVGQPANDVEKDVFANDKRFVGKSKELKVMLATVPLHDKNGDPIAAVRFEMEPFPGQTEKNVLERTMPLIKEMEARVASNKELNALQ